MATIKELETQISRLQERINRMTVSTSNMRDDIEQLKGHYQNLVEGLNQRLELVDKQFRKA